MNPKEEPTMSDEAQRVAIAEACGWRHRDCTRENPFIRAGYQLPNAFCELTHGWWRDDDPENPGVYASPPNYLTDLNAIHEARKVLTVDEGICFIRSLWSMVAHYESKTFSADAAFLLVDATASQQAEAFLKTIGKWSPKKRSAQ